MENVTIRSLKAGELDLVSGGEVKCVELVGGWTMCYGTTNDGFVGATVGKGTQAVGTWVDTHRGF